MKLVDLMPSKEVEPINEAKRQKIKTRFGDFSIEHDENPTAPGYSPEYFLEVNFNGQYLGHFIIAGDPRDKNAKGNVSVHLGKKQVKLRHDK